MAEWERAGTVWRKKKESIWPTVFVIGVVLVIILAAAN